MVTKRRWPVREAAPRQAVSPCLAHVADSTSEPATHHGHADVRARRDSTTFRGWVHDSPTCFGPRAGFELQRRSASDFYVDLKGISANAGTPSIVPFRGLQEDSCPELSGRGVLAFTFFLKLIDFFKKDFIYLFLQRGEGREKERQRNINRLSFSHP